MARQRRERRRAAQAAPRVDATGSSGAEPSERAIRADAACASKCIKQGGPVGIASQGKTYLIVGDHKPMNDQLAEYAGKTITVKGKIAERGGIAMIENAEIVRQ